MRRQEQKRQTVELNNQTQLPGNVQPSSQFQGPRQSHSEGETKEQRHIENQNRNGIQDQTHAQAQIEIQTDSQNHLQSKSQMYERKTNLSQTQCRIHKQHPQDLRDIPLPISNAATATVQTKKTDHFQPKARTSPRWRFSAKLTHAVHLRDQGQCTRTMPSGDRCSRQRSLDIYRLKPLSRGRRDELENFTTLCSAHHRMLHFMEASHCRWVMILFLCSMIGFGKIWVG